MEKKTTYLLIALCVYASLASGGVITNRDWPIPGHDLYHSGYTDASSETPLDNISLLYTFEAKGDLSSPVTADINGDGKAEILVGSSDNFLYALDSHAKVIWSYEASGSVSGPAVFDLYADNRTEILFGSKDGMVYALDSNGSRIWSYQTNGSIESTPIAVNVDRTPQLEVLVASDDKNLYILSASGEKISTHIMADPSLSTICAADINMDGIPDLFMGASNNKLDAVVSPENRRLSFDTGGSVSVPVYDEIGADGLPRVIIVSGEGKVYSLNYEEHMQIPGGSENQLVKYSSLNQDWEYNLSGEATSSPAIADLNGDGFPEVIVGSSGKVLYILNVSGDVLEKHSVNGKILASPVTADLNGDARPEIIFGSSDGILHVLNASGFRKWSYETKSVIDQPAAVSDLYRDGNLEIILSAANKLYVFGEKNNESNETPTTTLEALPDSTTTSAATTTTTSLIIPSTTTSTSSPELAVSSTISSTTTSSTSTTSSTTTTTLYKEVASVGLNDFVSFMLILVLMFLVVGALAKLLHNKYTKPKDAAHKPVALKDMSSVLEEHTLRCSESMNPEGALSKSADIDIPNTGPQRTIYTADSVIKPKKPPEPANQPQIQSPLITAEEKTVAEYQKALDVLKEKRNLPAETHPENTLPATEENQEFKEDLKTLEKESKRKY